MPMPKSARSANNMRYDVENPLRNASAEYQRIENISGPLRPQRSAAALLNHAANRCWNAASFSDASLDTIHRASTASPATDRKYAASGLRPNATNGVSHPRQRFTSRIQWHSPSVAAARPPLNRANELVQRFLLIGSTRSHRSAAIAAAAPAVASDALRCAPEPGRLIHAPASTPMSAVATAGIVLRSPSGSHAGSARWRPSSARS